MHLYVLVILVVSLSRTSYGDEPDCSVQAEYRFDCYPEKGGSMEVCQSRGCCWAGDPDDMTPGQGKSGAEPLCFYPQDFPAYTVTEVTKMPLGFLAELNKTETAFYPGEVTTLMVDVIQETDARLRVRVWTFCVAL